MGEKRGRSRQSRTRVGADCTSNMALPCFYAATCWRLKLKKRYVTFPSDEDLQSHEVNLLRPALQDFLASVPRCHRKHWQKLLRKAYPELKQDTLQSIMLKLVVRSWRLKASGRLIALHDFIEFCAGQGNLSAECGLAMMKGLAMDVAYHSDHNMLTRLGLRCWIDAVSEAKEGAMIWFGTRCSSFVGMCRNQHHRVAANGFWGDEHYSFVRDGNMMMVTTKIESWKL